MRHNNLRDLEANMLREVCKDVKVEPELLPVANADTQRSNLADKARLMSQLWVYGARWRGHFLMLEYSIPILHHMWILPLNSSTSSTKERKNVCTMIE